MTTIAYKDGILAADTCRVIRGVATRCSKLHRLDDGTVFAGSGNSTDIAKCLRWLNSGDRPPVKLESLNALHLTRSGLYFIDEELEPLFLGMGPFATGSGGDFAYAGMHMGLGAEAAAAMATELDHNSRLPVETMTL
jgi:hypothetical protein